MGLTPFLRLQGGCWDPAMMFQYLFLLVALTAAKDLVVDVDMENIETDVSLPAPVNSVHPHALQGAASSEPANLCLAKISPPPPAPPPPLQALQGVQLAMESSQ